MFFGDKFGNFCKFIHSLEVLVHEYIQDYRNSCSKETCLTFFKASGSPKRMILFIGCLLMTTEPSIPWNMMGNLLLIINNYLLPFVFSIIHEILSKGTFILHQKNAYIYYE